jgi:hypothetical protein
MTMQDDNLAHLPHGKDDASLRKQVQAFIGDTILDAETPPSPDPFADRRPNKLATGVLTGLSVVSFVAACLTPTTADDGVKFGAAMAMVWGILALAGALLCRYGREFWIPRRR